MASCLMKVSVVIPVKNGAETLESCLQSLRTQTIGDELEIIVLDSMSSDGSREIAKAYNAVVISIADGTFNHGLTRNLALDYANSEYLYFTVQDARVAEPEMLQNMLQHFEDAAVMGVVGHQAVAHERDKNPLLWFKRFSKPAVTKRKVEDAEVFKSLSVHRQQELVAWDNVVAMYRRTALKVQPFVATEFAEDWIWSKQALIRGWTLVHDPALVTWHYHHRDYSYSFKVAYAVNYHFLTLLHYRPNIPSLVIPILKATYHIFKNPLLTLREKCYWTKHNYVGLMGNYMSHLNFLVRLRVGGQQAVARGYQQYCKSIPQGKQKND